MSTLYLNDPLGLKETTLSNMLISNPAELLKCSADFLCKYFVHCDTTSLYFAQNLSTHLAQILSIIKIQRSNISRFYISDHEINWIKKMLEIPQYQPDATHSNYHDNDPIDCPTFDVKVFPFNESEWIAEEYDDPTIFFISHVSRLTGELNDIAALFKLIKSKNPQSIFIVDGSQSIGATRPIELKDSCDVYLGISSKFIGAEPHLGLAFISDQFFQEYVQDRDNYPIFNVEKYQKDIYSLAVNLRNPIYLSDYSVYIENLKKYAVEKVNMLDRNILYVPTNQAPQFLTLNFGSADHNKKFIEFAKNQKIIVSDNTGWSIVKPDIPLVRIGLSVRITEKDIDRLVEIIDKYIKI